MDKFARVGVRTNLGSRLVVPPGGYPHDGRTFDIHLEDGTVLQAECIIQCTGAVALSKPLTYLAPELVDENSGYVKVRRTLQVADSRFPKIFSLGDVADTGAHKAARPAYMQVPIVRENIERIMKWENENGREYTSEEEGKLDLQEYETPPAGIHLSLGFVRVTSSLASALLIVYVIDRICSLPESSNPGGRAVCGHPFRREDA